MKIDDIREYIVIVNEGSGCIFQPEDDTCSYILTAKHTIEDVGNQIKKLTRFEFRDKAWHPLSIQPLTDSDSYFPHPTKDIAIVKIPKIDGLDQIFRLDDFEDNTKGYSLCGYPETRRKMANQYRIDTGVAILTTNDNQLREGRIPGNPGREEIVGQSGGAIVKIIDNCLMLVGIQNKMVDAKKEEQMGRVEFTTLDSFDEITALFPDELSPLYPSHCKSFEFLKDQVMKLKGCFTKMTLTKKILLGLTEDVINNPLTPIMIRNHLKERLLIHKEKETSLNNKGLWIAWLELLVVLKVIGLNPQSEQDLDEIFNQYRIFYSASKKDWSSFIPDILSSDYRGLKENACIIVSNERKPAKSTIGKGILQNITEDYTSREMNIDIGVNQTKDSHKHIHLSAFQQHCIIAKEEEYMKFSRNDEEDLFNKLKQEYEDLISNY